MSGFDHDPDWIDSDGTDPAEFIAALIIHCGSREAARQWLGVVGAEMARLFTDRGYRWD